MTWEELFIRDMANFLRNHNISIYNSNKEYKGAEAIIAEVRSKFEIS